MAERGLRSGRHRRPPSAHGSRQTRGPVQLYFRSQDPSRHYEDSGRNRWELRFAHAQTAEGRTATGCGHATGRNWSLGQWTSW